MRYTFVRPYAYHASVALIALLAAGVVMLFGRITVNRAVRAIRCAALICPLAYLTFQRNARLPRFPHPLDDTLAKNPDS